MKSELESSVPVAQQVEEIEEVDQAVEYSLGEDGVIAQCAGEIEKGEGCKVS